MFQFINIVFVFKLLVSKTGQHPATPSRGQTTDNTPGSNQMTPSILCQIRVMCPSRVVMVCLLTRMCCVLLIEYFDDLVFFIPVSLNWCDSCVCIGLFSSLVYK